MKIKIPKISKQNEETLLIDCYDKSLALLRANSSQYGILAASLSPKAESRNYLSIFARDASICALGMMASGDKGLVKSARQSLVTLGSYQTKYGQIPNYVKPAQKTTNFWILDSIDATLWWLLAVHFYNQSGQSPLYYPKTKIRKAMAWLYCREHPVNRLLVQSEAADWADIMPREGAVLYSNALWLAVKKFYKTKDYKQSARSFDLTFYPYNKDLVPGPGASSLTRTLAVIKRRKKCAYYLSYVNYLFWGHDLDVYGNLLPVLFGVCPAPMAKQIMTTIAKRQKKSAWPVPSLYDPIAADSKEWRTYMNMHKQNLPHQYHNGGCWPYIGAFYAIALAKAGRRDEARTELVKVARSNALNDWEFNEWLHGLTGQPLGMKKQSWNAGVYVLAFQYLNNKIKF